MVRVKVCGVTNLEDALVAVAAGADALGFNFWPRSSRWVDPARAANIIEQLPPFVTAVGVFVDEPRSKLERLARASRLRAVQLHGEESPQEVDALARCGLTVLKALRVGRGFRPGELQKFSEADAFLLDTDVPGRRGGTGSTFNWRVARQAGRYGRIFLAGGLTVENVAEAIEQARPYGVDVCSGVERKPGVKDHARLREFVRRAKEAPVP